MVADLMVQGDAGYVSKIFRDVLNSKKCATFCFGVQVCRFCGKVSVFGAQKSRSDRFMVDRTFEQIRREGGGEQERNEEKKQKRERKETNNSK